MNTKNISFKMLALSLLMFGAEQQMLCGDHLAMTDAQKAAVQKADNKIKRLGIFLFNYNQTGKPSDDQATREGETLLAKGYLVDLLEAESDACAEFGSKLNMSKFGALIAEIDKKSENREDIATLPVFSIEHCKSK